MMEITEVSSGVYDDYQTLCLANIKKSVSTYAMVVISIRICRLLMSG